MANVSTLTEVTYVDDETVIGATNMNDIQDAIVELEDEVNTYGNVATLTYTVVSTF